MKPHVWEVELVSAPGIADNDEFWICRGCGASGGPKPGIFGKKDPPTLGPFLAGHGSTLTVGGKEHAVSKVDCDEAAQLIAAYRDELASRPPPNTEYVGRIKVACTASVQKFSLGQHVKQRGGEEHIGWIDAVFLTLESAQQTGNIPYDWYERLNDVPKTPKDGIWYGVVLLDGSLLIGQDDLLALDAPPKQTTNGGRA